MTAKKTPAAKAKTPAKTSKAKPAPLEDLPGLVRLHEENNGIPAEPAPGPDIGDYGDPLILETMTDGQLQNELLAMIAHVQHIVKSQTFDADDPYLALEKTKGAALKAEWFKRGKTKEDLDGKEIKYG